MQWRRCPLQMRPGLAWQHLEQRGGGLAHDVAPQVPASHPGV